MNNARLGTRLISIAASLLLLAGCGGGGGGGGGALPGGGGNATASPNPVSSGPTLSMNALSITSSTPQTFSVRDSGYTGTFSVSGCANVVSVSPSSAAGPTATFTVTPVAPGTCTLVISESDGRSVTLAVAYTITQGTIQ